MLFNTPVFIAALMAALLVLPASAQTQNPLAAARELYSAAAYEDALTVLDTLPADGLAGEREAAGLYRALCLFAVGRSAEANAAIDAIIQNNPAYRPSTEDMPPRVQVAFTNARRRLLPLIVQQQYNEGKSAYERQEYATAAGVFKQVLDELSDADLAVAANQPPLADLRTLALGFLTLSDKATLPPPSQRLLSSPPVAAPAPPRQSQSIYTGEEPNVVAPVVVRQQIPNFIGTVTNPRSGVVEIIINEKGTVDAARIMTSLDPVYDDRVVAATKSWVYKPATVDGMPVKFLRRVRVNLTKSP